MVELRARGFQQLVSEFVPPATVAAGVGQPCSLYIRTRNEQLAEREAKVGWDPGWDHCCLKGTVSCPSSLLKDSQQTADTWGGSLHCTRPLHRSQWRCFGLLRVPHRGSKVGGLQPTVRL